MAWETEMEERLKREEIRRETYGSKEKDRREKEKKHTHKKKERYYDFFSSEFRGGKQDGRGN